MANWKTLRIARDGARADVVLARPDVRNAFDERLIAELTDAMSKLGADDDVRVVVLTGDGDVFSAGADLAWMKKMAGYSYEENFADAKTAADMFHAIYACPKATIAAVNGHCMGGGIGLVAACDVAVAVDSAKFAFREVMLGISPATISPYVLRKMPAGQARDYFLSGRTFGADRATTLGLVNQIVDRDGLDAAVAKWTERYLRVGPQALAATKALIDRVADADIESVRDYTIDVLSRLRVGDEGQEGLSAFFEKRKPKWDPESDN